MPMHLFHVTTYAPDALCPQPGFTARCTCGWHSPERDTHTEAEVDGWAHESRTCERCGGQLSDWDDRVQDTRGVTPICSCCRAEVFA